MWARGAAGAGGRHWCHHKEGCWGGACACGSRGTCGGRLAVAVGARHAGQGIQGGWPGVAQSGRGTHGLGGRVQGPYLVRAQQVRRAPALQLAHCTLAAGLVSGSRYKVTMFIRRHAIQGRGGSAIPACRVTMQQRVMSENDALAYLMCAMTIKCNQNGENLQ